MAAVFHCLDIPPLNQSPPKGLLLETKLQQASFYMALVFNLYDKFLSEVARLKVSVF